MTTRCDDPRGASAGGAESSRSAETPPGALLSCIALALFSQSIGVICWNLVPRIAPLLLERTGVSSVRIGWLLGTFPQGVSLVFTPVFSLWSDRCQTRMGRRVPFLLMSVPILALSLLGIGITETRGGWLSCALMLYAIASVIPASFVYYLIPDVLPSSIIGRFTAWNGALSSLTAAAYHTWGLGWTSRHPTGALLFGAILLVVSLLCLAACPEKSLPRQSQTTATPPSRQVIVDALRSFVTDCFSEKATLFLFLCLGFNQASMILRTLFGILFATKDLCMTPDHFGHISGICAICGTATAMILGWVIDKRRPASFYLVGSCLVAFISLTGFFFATTPSAYFLIAILTTICYAVQGIAYTPLTVEFFPPEKFGQFTSANNIICTAFVMIASSVGGKLVSLYGYRLLFLWDFVFTSLGTIFLLVLIRSAKRPCSHC